MISVVAPNYNGEGTIGACLAALCASDCRDYEVVVVDDCSSDLSVDIIRRFPCRLVRLPRRAGGSLIMEPEIQVAHIFNFNLFRSLKNAFFKARWWIVYSLGTGDLLAESGTASRGLKANVMLQAFSLAALSAAALTGSAWTMAALVPALCVNLLMNRGLFRAFFREGGILFGIKAVGYYLFLYPVAVAGGALSGAAGMCRLRLNPGKGMQWHFQQSGMPDR
jgi:hypothetical protein